MKDNNWAIDVLKNIVIDANKLIIKLYSNEKIDGDFLETILWIGSDAHDIFDFYNTEDY